MKKVLEKRVQKILKVIRNLLKVEKIDKSTLKLKEERAYAVLDEIRVSPNVWYLRKVRNKKNS